MAKKILAAMLALTMCAGLAGCGKVSENKDSSSAKDKANTASADTDTTEDEKATDSKTIEGCMTVPTELNMDNIIIINIPGIRKDSPTNEELLAFAGLAVEQYNAAQTNDSEKYTQTLAFDKIVEPFAEIMTKMNLHGERPSSSKEKVMYNCGYMLFECSDNADIKTDDFIDIDSDDSAMTEGFKSMTQLALDGFNIDKTPLWENRKELVPMGELNRDTIIGFDLNGFERDGDDMFINFDMGILNGNDMFDFINIEAWYMDGTAGIIMDPPEHDDNIYADMTVYEIKQKLEEESIEPYSLVAAKKVYNIVSEYRAEQEAVGEDFKKKIESVFPMCTSSSGLDLAGDEPQAEGDKYVYDQMHRSGYPDGKAFIYDYFENADFYKLTGYTSTGGVTEFYPME